MGLVVVVVVVRGGCRSEASVLQNPLEINEKGKNYQIN